MHTNAIKHCFLISIEVVINFAFDFYNLLSCFTIELFSNVTIALYTLNNFFYAFKTRVLKSLINIESFLNNKCNLNNCRNIKFLCQLSCCLICSDTILGRVY